MLCFILLGWLGSSRDRRLENTLDEQGESIEKAEQRLDGHDAAIEENRAAIEENRQAIDREQQTNEEQGKDLLRLEDAGDERDHKLTAQGATLVDLESKLEKIAALAGQVRELETRRVEDLNEIERLRRLLRDLERGAQQDRARLDRIEKVLGITPDP